MKAEIQQPHVVMICPDVDLVYEPADRLWHFIRYTKKGTFHSERFDTKLRAFLALVKEEVDWDDVLREYGNTLLKPDHPKETARANTGGD